ncbi:Ig-like domain-containing protein [Flammeovirga kamogawensis]|uniref:Ig-like domain-containing protein n=1 Tax=Flammeovirga kamogawensis TaxID=373891 RepID=A0ABX8GS31_9BACT|nr:Ig-like domain-containing protein [Flammeovirga kamogawensis]MBB6462686.1 uncharacterized protein YjdB [Flammeovirga kamogawensis]QWG06077.1 Ig-like domain-containing protein [Flammeovirga kamogawensis]TRX67910.1 carbohydrate-binding protein [Flammeovirga kamogawensis]
MKKQKLIFCLSLLLSTLLSMHVFGQNHVEIRNENQNARLYVNNQRYIIRGVCYLPIPKGGTSPTWENIDTDIALMQQAGINTIRTYAPILENNVIDKLAAGGIRIIMGFGYSDPSHPYKIVDGTYIEYVNQYKDHPAILMWEFGNEYNYHTYPSAEGGWFDGGPMEWFNALQNAAASVKAIDPHHPISTAHGEKPTKYGDMWGDPIEVAPDVDVWGMNVYRWTGSSGAIWDFWYSFNAQGRVKGAYLSEAGADSYDVRIMEENQGMHAADMKEILSQVLTAVNPEDGKKIIDCGLGITLFQFTDGWNKTGNPATHDVGNVDLPGSFPQDNFNNEEWFGITTIERQPKQAFYEVADIYNNLKAQFPDPPMGVVGNTVNVTGITVNTSNVTLYVGDQLTIFTEILPENASNKTVSWSASSIAAGVDNGTITANQTGSSIITATTVDGNFSATCNVTVINRVQPTCDIDNQIEAESYVTMNGIQLEATTDIGGGQNVGWIDAGDWLQYDIALPACTYEVTFRVASLDGGGILELKNENSLLSSSQVTQTSGWQNWVDITEEVTISEAITSLSIHAPSGGYNINWVKIKSKEDNTDIAPNSIALSTSSIALTIGEQQTITANILPSNATDKSIVWSSSNPAIAAVDQNGFITAISGGSAIITGTTSNQLNATCTVTVQNPIINVSTINLNTITETLIEGNSTILTATVLPENATDKSVTWSSSNTAIASVNQNGLVTAISEGSAIISVISNNGNISASATINVEADNSISCNFSTLIEAETYTASLDVQVENTTDTNGGQNVGWIDAGDWLVWNVNIPACTYKITYRIASAVNGGTIQIEEAGGVNVFGQVTFNGTGGWQSWIDVEQEITIENDISELAIYTPTGGFNINWIKIESLNPTIPATSITLNNCPADVALNTSHQLTATVLPSNTTDKAIIWSSSDENIVTVDQTGIVNVIGYGEAIITAVSSNQLSASCTVILENNIVPVSSISLFDLQEKNEITIEEDASFTLSPRILPQDATNKNINWSSSNTAIVTVTQDGTIMGISEGNATITVITEDGNLSTSAPIIVTAKPIGNGELTLLWEDQFNGNSLDPNNWVMENSNGCDIGNCSFGNQELQAYTNRNENVSVENGKLVLTARKETLMDRDFTSGKVMSREKVNINYGVVEASIKLPDMNNGLWPAFWMLHTRNNWPYTGEIDILEAGAKALERDVNEEVKSNIFWRAEAAGVDANLQWGNEDAFSYYTGEQSGKQAHEAFFVYRLYWTPDYIRTTILQTDSDGEPIPSTEYEMLRIDNDPNNPTFQNEFFSDDSFYVIMNLAVGGWFPFNPDNGENNAANVTALPTPGSEREMLIDYVRVYSIDGIGAISSGPGYANPIPPTKFGIYQDGTETAKSLEYGIDAELWVWSGSDVLLNAEASVYGDSALNFTMPANTWSGLGFNSSDVLNLSNYNGGTLRFKAKTNSQEPFRIHTWTRTGGREVQFGRGENAYGLVRDGQWHDVEIPLNDVVDNLSEVIRPFIIGEIPGNTPSSDLEIVLDEIHYATSGSNARLNESALALEQEITINAYPNPATNIITLNGELQNFSQLTVFNIDGKIQFSQNIDNELKADILISNLKTGIYFIQLNGAEHSKSIKFIKK